MIFALGSAMPCRRLFVGFLLFVNSLLLPHSNIYALNLEHELEVIRKDYGLPAIAGIFISDRVSFASATGVRKIGSDAEVTIHDRWHLGSCTKAMTATLIAILIEKHDRLDWSTTIGEIFSSEFQVHRDFQNVTIEMLLAHRGGVTGDLLNYRKSSVWKKLRNEDVHGPKSRKFLSRAILSFPASVAPGSQFLYSNAGYSIAAAMIEKITGLPWQYLMIHELFEPLGMRSCGFGAAGRVKSQRPDQPWGHFTGVLGKMTPVKPDRFGDNPSAIWPGGGVHCSLAHWKKFISLHISKKQDYDPIISRESIEKLQTRYPGQNYTYGGWIKVYRHWAGGDVLNHDGSNTLHYATAWLAPELSSAYLSVSNYGAKPASLATDKTASLLIQLYNHLLIHKK